MPDSAEFQPPPTSIQLTVQPPDSILRKQEPVTCGVPFPRGLLTNIGHLQLFDEKTESIPLQAKTLDSWADGSARWVLITWLADIDGPTHYQLIVDTQLSNTVFPKNEVTARIEAGTAIINANDIKYQLRTDGRFPFDAIEGPLSIIDLHHSHFRVEDQFGNQFEPVIQKLRLVESGPIRAVLAVEGSLQKEGAAPLAEFCAMIHFFAGTKTL